MAVRSGTTVLPRLGRRWGEAPQYQVGYGEVQPNEVFNGGDPTGHVIKVHWLSWGGARAIGSGISEYVAPNQIVAEGRDERARIVAFNLGTCGGLAAYTAIEWYFPRQGGRFDLMHYINICTGQYASLSRTTVTPCRLNQLSASGSWQGASGAMLGGINFANIGSEPCSLGEEPRVELRGANGTVLNVEVADLGGTPITTVIVQPHVERGAFVKVFWNNWCGSRTPLEVEVALADSPRTLTVNDEGFSGHPRCDRPSARSLLSVGPFQPPE